jgi:hypothetical protein
MGLRRLDLGKTVCFNGAYPGLSVDIVYLLGQMSESGFRETLQPRQNDLEFAVLFGGGFVEGSGMRAELHIDGLAFDLIGPFEIRAMTFGGVSAAGALRPAAFIMRLKTVPFRK